MNDGTQSPTPRVYLLILVILMVLLALTIGAAFLDLPGHTWGIAIALGIAGLKAIAIMLYYMHVKFGPKQVAAFASAGFAWLAILFVLTCTDYLTRNHPRDLNFKGEPHLLVEQK